MLDKKYKTPECMLGAIVGDIAGSVYERFNIKHCISEAELISPNSVFTDDSVMTCAVAEGFVTAFSKCPTCSMPNDELFETIKVEIINSMKKYGKQYINAGYGIRFLKWILMQKSKPYNSYGNGSAMRVSYAGWLAQTLEEAEQLAKLSAEVTHNHPEGIKGAVVVAGSIFLLREMKSKEVVKEYVSKYYDIDFSLDDIRETYRFDVSCQGSVPQAIVAFLEGENFVDVISKAISIGGDSDTIAAIAGSLAETIYEIPCDIKRAAIEKLDENLMNVIDASVMFLKSRIKEN